MFDLPTGFWMGFLAGYLIGSAVVFILLMWPSRKEQNESDSQ